MSDSFHDMPAPASGLPATFDSALRNNRRFHIAAGLFAVVLVVLEYSTFHELYVAWTAADSYYSHGFLVPLISLFFVWQKRAELRAAPLRPSLSGYVLIALACLMLLASDSLGLRLIGEFALLPMIIGLVLLFFGTRHLALVWFPILFLVFMIPIPPSITQSISLRVKLFATDTAVRLANLVTLPMVRDGSFVHFGDDQLLVGEVCGGLRSLIALIAFGTLMSYISKTRLWARLIILFISGPVAIISNMFRIFGLCVVGYFWGSKVAAGHFHDISGILIFVVAFALLFFLEAVLRRIAPEKTKSPSVDAPAAGDGGVS